MLERVGSYLRRVGQMCGPARRTRWITDAARARCLERASRGAASRASAEEKVGGKRCIEKRNRRRHPYEDTTRHGRSKRSKTGNPPHNSSVLTQSKQSTPASPCLSTPRRISRQRSPPSGSYTSRLQSLIHLRVLPPVRPCHRRPPNTASEGGAFMRRSRRRRRWP